MSPAFHVGSLVMCATPHCMPQMAEKAAPLPSLPWYGYDAGNGTYGVWMQGPSRLLGHAGFLFSIHEGHGQQRGRYENCPLLMSYLQPGSRLWRLGQPPFYECCEGGVLNRSCLPRWLQVAMGNLSVIYAPGVMISSDGSLPSRHGSPTQHFVVYYSTTPSTPGDGLACIGRLSGQWQNPDESCAPIVVWEDDQAPVICSNSAARTSHGSEQIADVRAGPKFHTKWAWKAHADGEPYAHGAEPFFGLDGSLYLVYGSREPASIVVVQLNETSGRLPSVAQPGYLSANQSSHLYHLVASGPNFQLGPDVRAPPTDQEAYISGSIRPHNATTSLVRNPFILPRKVNGTAQYLLFIEWFTDGIVDAGGNVSRVYVGRSDSPIGPFYDRIGNALSERSPVVLGDKRTISIVSARWGVNCDDQGYDVSAVAKLKCEGRASCDWVVLYTDLDAIDPDHYSDFRFPANTASIESRHGTAGNIPAAPAGCRRALNVTYRCTKQTSILYAEETRGAEEHVYLPPEAANGSVARLHCTTPDPMLLPGGTLFADPQRLGGNLHFTSVSHSGIFTYARGSRLTYVFTFQFHTRRSSLPEFGARQLRFADDGWPVLADDPTPDWSQCYMPEAIYSLQAPSSYWEREAHYDPDHRHEAHIESSSSTRTHCRHHSLRGTHCVGGSLRASHPQIGVAGSEGSMLHGRIDEPHSQAWWREQEDHCNPLVETILGRTMTCTRFAGRGDLDPTKHVSTMERIRGCPQLKCNRKFPCKPDPLTRAAAGTTSPCSDGLVCKQLPKLRVVAWDSDHFFNGGMPVETSRDGRKASNISQVRECHATPYVSRIDPALGTIQGGSFVTVYGSGFGHPARCRFGWLETEARDVTAHRMVCLVPSLNLTYSSPDGEYGPRSFTMDQLLRAPIHLEVSMMSRVVLDVTPLPDAVRSLRGDNFTKNRHIFEYYDPSFVAISFLRPMGGPIAGATCVDVHGAGFRPNDANQNLKCRFTTSTSAAVMQATFHNAHRISCMSPAYTLGIPGHGETSAVSITLDEQVFFTGESNNFTLGFTYYSMQNDSDPLLGPLPMPSVAVSSIHPTGGPARGGTFVTVSGQGFAALDNPNLFMVEHINRDDDPSHLLNQWHDPYKNLISRAGLFCIFAGANATVQGATVPHDEPVVRDLVPGTAESTEVMVCETPPLTSLERAHGPGATASVSLDITLNGNRLEGTVSNVLFSYYREDRHGLPKLHKVLPDGGSMEGGTLINISGTHLRKLTAAHMSPTCRFGDGSWNSTVSATLHRGTSAEAYVLCVAPRFPGEEATHDVALNVAQNGQDYVRRPLWYHYYALDKLILEGMLPVGGPASGGTAVVLQGLRLGISRGGLLCQFGQNPPSIATAASPQSIRCESPPIMLPENATYAEVDVRVSINNDATSLSLSSKQFTYFNANVALTVSSIYPQAGLTTGGTAVTVHGGPFRELGAVFCMFGSSLPVRAERPPSPPPSRPSPGRDGDIRLAHGGSIREGRVEIYHNGHWGTICDDEWDIADAQTVCRQLGYPDALNATCCGLFGPGSGPIWLDNVQCAEREQRLDRCPSHGWGVHNCDHHEDAGVICSPHLTATTPSPPPDQPPPPFVPWARLDDFQLTRSPAGAHLGRNGRSIEGGLLSLNASAGFDSFVCHSPPLDEALGSHNPRAVVQTVELKISINEGSMYGIGQPFTYYKG